jgi:ADP-ribose pyrophosphatase YjhB (NUDIX family)
MTSTTATLLLIDPISEEVIIGVRGDNAWVYPGADSLPGGFMEARWTEEHETGFVSKFSELLATAARTVLGWINEAAERFHEGEDAETCALREAEEEMGIKLTRDQLEMFDTRTNSRTDTRAHVTNVCFYAELTPEQSALVPDGADVSHLDDLKAIKRWKIDDLFLELPNIQQIYPMAFNHFDLMIGGLLKWKREKRYAWLETEVKRLQELTSNLSWAADTRQGGA